MLIEGFGISGYRSFAGDIQRIGPLEKINLFLGQNNSGKSNILLFLTKHYSQAVQASHGRPDKWIFDEILDRPLGDKSNRLTFELCVKTSGANYDTLKTRFRGQIQWNHNLDGTIKKLLSAQALKHRGDGAWFRYEGMWGAQLALSQTLVQEIAREQILSEQDWRALWSAITAKSGGSIIQHWIPETLRALSPNSTPPSITLVPAIRKVSDTERDAVNDYSGIGIIERLAQLQNPTHNQQSLKEQFEKITDFLRNVTGNSSAQLEVPFDRKTIIVHMDGKTLPLHNLGTGIHEVIILAVASTVLQDQIVCIEEPELHLHPLLQRKLVTYLRDKTSNQYFITTHSAHLLDTVGAAIFHVRNRTGNATVDPVSTATEKARICADLGYRAADLLQANSVIWVEGPSDRIYLNHWLHSVDPALVEGLHYSIMFYGGRLLSHLSANDPEVGEFISLRRLNRYISVVVDSDRSGPHGRINATKRRVIDEFNQGPGFAWLTKGREIENYINRKILEKAIKGVYSEAATIVTADSFSQCLRFKTSTHRTRENLDKVKVAREVAKQPADLLVLDLKKMIGRLVQFIRDANEISDV